MAIRVAIFEDNRKYRESVSILINSTFGFHVCGAFQDALDVIDKIENSQPDVVLMDIQMPFIDGIDALKTIRSKFPKLSVLMQTVFEDDDKIFECICSGASGYVLKNTPPARILDAITESFQGGAPMSPVIARKVMDLLKNQNRQTDQPVSINYNLSPREIEVLSLMVNGLSYKMIADQCSISFETVKFHIRNIYTKLHVVSMTEAVAKAIKNNIV